MAAGHARVRLSAHEGRPGLHEGVLHRGLQGRGGGVGTEGREINLGSSDVQRVPAQELETQALSGIGRVPARRGRSSRRPPACG
eukprot:4253126-Heterocapsa_arctica.AAC.1